MAITTTDVCTNVVAGNEVSSNGTIIVSCLPTGSYKKIDSVFEASITYNNLENKLTNRFDDVTTIVGA
jgi:hypothetical protein